MKKLKIIIIGTGPGGLSAAMLLAKKGYDVEVYEKNNQPGGRTSEIKLNGYRFDVGPTFFMMKFVLDEIFAECGLKTEDYLECVRLSPMYKLILPDNRNIKVYEEKDKMAAELKRVFPGEEKGLEKFYKREKIRYEKLMPILKADNQSIFDVFRWRFISALPYLSIGSSIYEQMGKYFDTPLARLTFTFQAKYLGMSPWECPGSFGLVPYVEHEYGIYHVIGGLSEISRQMAKAAEELGAKIFYKKPVEQILVENKKAVGVKFADGGEARADKVVLNADFGYAMKNLIPEGLLKKYHPKKLAKKKISCSIFMMYLGVKKKYDLDHHTIVFAKDYKKNVANIFNNKSVGDDISFYVRDAGVTDSALAPAGKSALYVLVPVSNNRANIDWDKEKKRLRETTLTAIKNRMGLVDIEENIEEEKIITPRDWEDEYNVYEGAVFNLAHNLSQMLWFRPHNRFEELKNLYLVGGGTHPGSGLPTIMQSGKITADLIEKDV